MAISNNNQGMIAFKNLLGKSNTDETKGVNNEAEGIFFNIGSDKVWTSSIDATPGVAISAGVVIRVDAVLTVDSTSNGHAYFATWPSIPPTGTDPTTASAYSYGNGLLMNINSGDRVIDAVSTQYGFLYEAKPYDTTSVIIPPGDPRDWVYQYNSGVFFQQDNVGSNPLYISIYAYVGDNLSNLTLSGGGGQLIKYRILPAEVIIVPTYSQYWLYGDLTIEGLMDNYGQLVIANGGVVLSGGTLSNYGQLSFVSLGLGSTPSFLYSTSSTIGWDLENTIFGPSVSFYVLHDSLTASHLNTSTNGGATAGYVLSVDNSGYFNWISPSSNGQTLYQIGLTTSFSTGEIGLTLSSTPLLGTRIQVFVNGQLQELGDNSISYDCHFGTTYSSIGFSSLASGDQLVWNSSNAGFNLSISDKIDIVYDVL